MTLRGDIIKEINNVTLLAVSKTQPLDLLLPLIIDGQRHFGENRLQEAESKFKDLRQNYPDLVLHYIGHLQINKVERIVRFFDVIETVDRAEVVSAIAKAMRKWGKTPKLLIEVNLGEEPQKSGILAENLPSLIDHCHKEGLDIAGLMTIPPQHLPARPFFQKLHTLAAQYNLKELSMGMSADYKEAVACGATTIRIGTLLFGKRR